MRQKIWALLVRSQSNDLVSLRQVLEQLVRVSEARTCQEAGRYLERASPPHLVFTDTKLADGIWLDVLKLATRAPQPVNVIVAARDADIRLYIEAMEHGAFDFVTASALVPEVTHVLRNAAENVLTRRAAQDRLSPPTSAGSGKRKPVWWSPSG